MMFSWFVQVGDGSKTLAGGIYCFINSNPILSAPVPERAWAEATLPSFKRADSLPKINFWLPVTNPGIPSIGIYS